MKKLTIPNNVTRTFGKVGFKLKKSSPEILVVAGVAGVITSAIMACKATTKAGAIVEEAKENMSQIHQVAEMGVEDYSDKDLKKDTTIVYAQTAVKFVKLYGPSVALGVLSITSILASNNILKKRNVALAAAYTAIDKSFKEYRSRVVERFGDDLDRELRFNVKAKEVETTVTDENGNEKTEKTTIEVADPRYSEFAKCFDEYCLGWTKDPEYNLTWLRAKQAEATNKLQSNGYLILNDVYEMLGFPKTNAGMVVGWIYDDKNPVGDNYVDFGLYEFTAKDFVNGRERSVWLDFNVDGNIYGLI